MLIWLLVLLLVILAVGGGIALSKFLFLILVVALVLALCSARSTARPSEVSSTRSGGCVPCIRRSLLPSRILVARAEWTPSPARSGRRGVGAQHLEQGHAPPRR